jgi:hypothetical protein
VRRWSNCWTRSWRTARTALGESQDCSCGKRVVEKVVLGFVIVCLQGGIENRLEVRRGGHGGNVGYGM